MARNLYESDIQAILARRYDNGGDLWATPDGKLQKGSPFTTLESACLLRGTGRGSVRPRAEGHRRADFRRTAGRRAVPAGAGRLDLPLQHDKRRPDAVRLGALWRPEASKDVRAPPLHPAFGRRLEMPEVQLRPRAGDGVLEPRPDAHGAGRLPVHAVSEPLRRAGPRGGISALPLDDPPAAWPLPLRDRHAVHAGPPTRSAATTCSSTSTCCPFTAGRRATRGFKRRSRR